MKEVIRAVEALGIRFDELKMKYCITTFSNER